MAELLAFSQSSLFLLPKDRLQSYSRGFNSNAHCLAPLSVSSTVHVLANNSLLCSTFCMHQKQQFPQGIKSTFSYDYKVPTTFAVHFTRESVDSLPDTGGNADDFGGASNSGGVGSGGGSGSGGGGNSGGDNGNNGSEGDSDGSKDHKIGSNKKKTALLMSQKLTLGYAVLVGAGGVMGFLKSGSQKSLLSGVLSAALLYYVYTLLPTKPVFASALGFGLSAALLGVMGSRFKKSGKIFPAGIVSLVSLVMSGGYLHGIMRSVH